MTRSTTVVIASLVLALAAWGSQTVRSHEKAPPRATPKTEAAVAAAVADAAFLSERVVAGRSHSPAADDIFVCEVAHDLPGVWT